jgi:dTDP-4-amino-4,6-dideoxygalactose transaminase
MFSHPYRTGLEEGYLAEALKSAVWHGDGEFTKKVTEWLDAKTGALATLLTPSGTHALELAALLLELGPDDEVICPSFTFPSTATAIALRGATPVFVDVESATMNIDVRAAEAAVTDRTKAIFVVHYGGVAADLEALQALAQRHGIALVEDNAHGMGAYYDEQHLGTFGTFGIQSWHDTKNFTCGEGGSLLINAPEYRNRAEILREKGTNRSQFLRGQVDKYTWVDHGSSYLPSEFQAALLMAQFDRYDEIQTKRHQVWDSYAEQLAPWAGEHGVQLMTVPERRQHPAHLYYLVLPTEADQRAFIDSLSGQGIVAPFHYQPLHESPAGRKFGRVASPCGVSVDRAQRLVRLPLHAGLTEDDVQRVVSAAVAYRPVTR